MPDEPWFPLKYELPEGEKLQRVISSSVDWHIYRVDREQTALVVRDSLSKRWVECGLLPDSVFGRFTYGKEKFRFLLSGRGRRLEVIGECDTPDSKADCLAFALSLRETRAVETDAPLHSAIYVERYSRLLPTWPVSQGMTDAEVLGEWLTGGVSIPATSLRRLSSLLGWLDKEDVRQIVDAAGFSASRRGGPTATKREHFTKDSEPIDVEEKERLVPRAHEDVRQAKGLQFTLFGRPALTEFFNEHIIDIIENADRYKSFGIEFPASIVLHGPPGCGKTYAVERLAEYLDWPIFHIDSNSVGSPYIHETSRKVGEVFDKAMDAAPSLIVIDEMESYLSDRQLHGSTGLHHVEEVAEFLRRIPEANERKVLVIGMTNRLEMIDPAILRRGRFDHVIEVGMPSQEEVAELIKSLIQGIPLAGEIDVEDVCQSLAGRALSDSAFVVREAARLAARAGKRALDDESLRTALQSLPSVESKKNPIGFIQH